MNFSEQINEYKSIYNQRIISNIPLVVVINGRNFRKTTALLEKPFCSKFLDGFSKVMIVLMSEISGSVFSYSFNDEIVLILNNTCNWYNNNIQDIVSSISSISSIEFYNFAKENDLSLIGNPIFISNIFAVPNISDAIKVLISKQQSGFYSSIYNACFYELLKKYNVDVVKNLLFEKSVQERVEILYNECNIDFNNYNSSFKKGIAAYRAPKIIDANGEQKIKNKLVVNMEIPVFSKDYEFLNAIFKSGRDILRAENE